MTDDQQSLPTSRVAELDHTPDATRWLIDGVWTKGVGIIGGIPKSAKSWFGLDMAIRVASKTHFLGRFQVHEPGPALVYLAADALSQVRERIAGICAHRRILFDSLDLHVITAPAVRLDKADDQRRLAATIVKVAPKLLVLDPLVRLHRLDENNSGEISHLLGYLRELQSAHALAIVLVHHMSKRVRPQLGQALRGSGDLHAWVDHGAYLIRSADKLRLTLEHRSAASQEPIDLRLVSLPDGSETHLELDPRPAANNVKDSSPALHMPDLHELVIDMLRRAQRPIPRAMMRASLRVNNNRLGESLTDLERQGKIVRSDLGLTLA